MRCDDDFAHAHCRRGCHPVFCIEIGGVEDVRLEAGLRGRGGMRPLMHAERAKRGRGALSSAHIVALGLWAVVDGRRVAVMVRRVGAKNTSLGLSRVKPDKPVAGSRAAGYRAEALAQRTSKRSCASHVRVRCLSLTSLATAVLPL